jgi:hypothetical protein
VLTGVLILAAGMAVVALVSVRRSRIAIPVTRIAAAADATLVRIQGRVRCDAPLVAPYSGRPCVYYKIIFAYAEFPRHALFEHSESCDFVVTDGSGVARVSRERARFEAMPDEGEKTRASRLSPRALEIIRALKWPVPDIAAVEFAECAIAIGDEVNIAGTPSREVDVADQGERGFRDEPGTQLVFAGNSYVLKAASSSSPVPPERRAR